LIERVCQMTCSLCLVSEEEQIHGHLFDIYGVTVEWVSVDCSRYYFYGCRF